METKVTDVRGEGEVSPPRAMASREDGIRCPKCKVLSGRGEWIRVYRRIVGEADTDPALSLFEHRPCRELVYQPWRRSSLEGRIIRHRSRG